MKKATAKKRKSIDFSKGERGRYANMKLVIAGAISNDKPGPSERRASAEAVLKKVSRVLDSAGPTKQELESAIDRARHLIDSARHA